MKQRRQRIAAPNIMGSARQPTSNELIPGRKGRAGGPGPAGQLGLQFSIWTIGVLVAVAATVVVGLWATRRVGFYELALLLGFTAWYWFILPRFASASTSMVSRIAAGFVSIYVLANLLLQLYLVNHVLKLERDNGVILQDLWWTLHGAPLVNTIDAGGSQLAIHQSYILFGLVPFYAAWHSATILFVAQDTSLALAGWLFYCLARRYLSALAALGLLAVFLLYPPFQFTSADFYEASLAAPFVVLTIDSGLRRRSVRCWIFALLLSMVKETFALMVPLIGIYFLLIRRYREGVNTIFAGVVVAALDFFVVKPWFRHHYTLRHLSFGFVHQELYAALGTSPSAIANTIILHPHALVVLLTQPGKLTYIVAAVAPYLVLGFVGSLIWLAALPELALSLFVDVSKTKLWLFTGGRLAMMLSGSLAIATVLTLRRVTAHVTNRAWVQGMVASAMVLSTLSLAPTWLNSTNIHRTPVVSASDLATLPRLVPPTASIASPYTIVTAFAQRPIVFDYDDVKMYDLYRKCSDYVVFERVHRDRVFFSAIRSAKFRRVWVGQVFELWRAKRHSSCGLSGDTWFVRPRT